MYSDKIKCVCKIHQIIYYLTPEEKMEGGGCPFCYKKEIGKKKEIIRFCKENGIHNKYGAGVPLTKEEHVKFHSIYGNKNNTKEQLKEFIKK